MIDNIKVFALDKQKTENDILENGVIQLSSSIDYVTAEVKEYPKRGKDLNLDVKFTENSATINGSFHKFHNLETENGCQNYDDFYYSNLQNVISGIVKKYSLENNTSITNLEFGFNLAVNDDPQIILENSVLMKDFKDHNKNLKFLGKGDYKEFQMTDYSIKIYNKSKQFNLQSNVLRVEIKIIRKRYLQKLGIFQLEDLLNKDVLVALYNDLRSKIEGMIIVDRFDPNLLPIRDQNKLEKYTNPNYWIRLRSLKTQKQIYRLKRDCNRLLVKLNLLNTKSEILQKLSQKFSELIEIENYKVVA